MEAAPVARGFFTGDYIGLAALSGSQEGDHQGEGGSGFVPLFVMTNCKDSSCTAVGTADGTPAGPDSTDAFTNSRT
jgi:hypothetical protein